MKVLYSCLQTLSIRNRIFPREKTCHYHLLPYLSVSVKIISETHNITLRKLFSVCQLEIIQEFLLVFQKKSLRNVHGRTLMNPSNLHRNNPEQLLLLIQPVDLGNHARICIVKESDAEMTLFSRDSDLAQAAEVWSAPPSHSHMGSQLYHSPREALNPNSSLPIHSVLKTYIINELEVFTTTLKEDALKCKEIQLTKWPVKFLFSLSFVLRLYPQISKHTQRAPLDCLSIICSGPLRDCFPGGWRKTLWKEL